MFFNTDDLYNTEIALKLVKTTDENKEKNYVPAYHFDICFLDGTIIGGCDLRVGHNKNTYYGGNIGYHISEDFRGHGYAKKASELLFILARKHNMEYVIITCDPNNIPSYKTCINLGMEFIKNGRIPRSHDLHSRMKKVAIFKKKLI